jgi:hypothetical protein
MPPNAKLRHAIVRIPERPKIFAISSEAGNVTLKPSRTFHWFLAGKQSEWDSLPIGYEWSWKLEVIHPEYEPLNFQSTSGSPTIQ